MVGIALSCALLAVSLATSCDFAGNWCIQTAGPAMCLFFGEQNLAEMLKHCSGLARICVCTFGCLCFPTFVLFQ